MKVQTDRHHVSVALELFVVETHIFRFEFLQPNVPIRSID